jgi:hypothetical protein
MGNVLKLIGLGPYVTDDEIPQVGIESLAATRSVLDGLRPRRGEFQALSGLSSGWLRARQTVLAPGVGKWTAAALAISRLVRHGEVAIGPIPAFGVGPGASGTLPVDLYSSEPEARSERRSPKGRCGEQIRGDPHRIGIPIGNTHIMLTPAQVRMRRVRVIERRRVGGAYNRPARSHIDAVKALAKLGLVTRVVVGSECCRRSSEHHLLALVFLR